MIAAQDLIADLRARGVTLSVAGDRLHYRPVAAATPDLRARMVTMKEELIVLVERFEERAAIIEFDAGHPRAEAEERAWASILHSEVSP